MPVYSSVPGFLDALRAALTNPAMPMPQISVFEDPDARSTGFNVRGVSHIFPLAVWKQHYLRGPMYDAAALALWTADLRKVGINFDPKEAVKNVFSAQQREAEHLAQPTAWARLLTDEDEYPD